MASLSKCHARSGVVLFLAARKEVFLPYKKGGRWELRKDSFSARLRGGPPAGPPKSINYITYLEEYNTDDIEFL